MKRKLLLRIHKPVQKNSVKRLVNSRLLPKELKNSEITTEVQIISQTMRYQIHLTLETLADMILRVLLGIKVHVDRVILIVLSRPLKEE
jgi:hypothetical protein